MIVTVPDNQNTTQADWDAYLDAAVGRVETSRPVRHGYRSPAELHLEAQTASIHRPTELDAITQMILGTSHTHYSQPTGWRISEDDSLEAHDTAPRAFKWCSVCETEKPSHYFHRDRTKPDGRQSMCMTCRESYRQYRAG